MGVEVDIDCRRVIVLEGASSKKSEKRRLVSENIKKGLEKKKS